MTTTELVAFIIEFFEAEFDYFSPTKADIEFYRNLIAEAKA